MPEKPIDYAEEIVSQIKARGTFEALIFSPCVVLNMNSTEILLEVWNKIALYVYQESIELDYHALKTKVFISISFLESTSCWSVKEEHV